jgi:hypothetical protein
LSHEAKENDMKTRHTGASRALPYLVISAALVAMAGMLVFEFDPAYRIAHVWVIGWAGER